MCILELSTVLMYKFHYDYIKDEFGNNSKLLFTITHSLMYEIKTEDVYENFNSDEEMLILLIIRLSQNTVIVQTNKSFEKRKMKPAVLRLKNLLD